VVAVATQWNNHIDEKAPPAAHGVDGVEAVKDCLNDAP